MKYGLWIVDLSTDDLQHVRETSALARAFDFWLLVLGTLQTHHVFKLRSLSATDLYFVATF